MQRGASPNIMRVQIKEDVICGACSTDWRD